VWAQATDSAHLGQYAALLLDYSFDKTNTVISVCLSRFFIARAIKEFPNTADTVFFYLSLDQHF
jgi:hypothetical protein